MYQYIVKRILLMIPTLLGAAVLVFFLLRLIPGDICELRMAGTGGYFDKEALDICRAEIGIDQPLFMQFIDFIWGFIQFDLGTSMWTNRPIGEEIALRFELSLQVAIMATITATVIAIPLGTISAIKQDTWVDYVVRIFTNAGAAIGDLLVLTKPLGTGIIGTAIKHGHADPHHSCAAVDSMVALNRGAATAMRAVGAGACTDITGFGLLGHLLNIARESAVSLEIDYPSLPVLPGVHRYIAREIVPEIGRAHV